MVHVIGDYYIAADETEYKLFTDLHKTGKDGKAMYDINGHYSSFESALKGCRKRIFKDKVSGRDIELDEAIRAIQDIKDEFDDMFRKAEE